MPDITGGKELPTELVKKWQEEITPYALELLENAYTAMYGFSLT